MRALVLSIPLGWAMLCPSLVAQPCVSGALQLQNDRLPCNPAGMQPVAPIAGLCVGDKAAAVLSVASLPQPLSVLEAGVLFAGPPGSRVATAILEIYDGLSIGAGGRVKLGTRIFRDSTARPLQPNALTLIDISGAGVTASSGSLVVAFEMVTNPNELFPGLGCVLGYTASFAADTTLPPGSPCETRPGTNLVYDGPNRTWWDVTRFQIGGQPWCRGAFNGNWVIRACVSVPASPYPGTGEDYVMTSGTGTGTSTQPLFCVNRGDTVTLNVTSPGGTFTSGFNLFLIDVLATAGPPPATFFPGLYIRPTAVFVGPQVFGPGGVTFGIQMPRGPGLSVLFQGALINLSAANGLFASSEAHVALLH